MIEMNELLTKDYLALETECVNMRESGASYFDIVCFLNDYIYSLSDTVDNNFLKNVYALEEWYHQRFTERECNL